MLQILRTITAPVTAFTWMLVPTAIVRAYRKQ